MTKTLGLDILFGNTGIGRVFKPYEAEAMTLLWSTPNKGYSSRDVFVAVNKVMTGTISRASIINFLNGMVDADILGYTEITGKGGHRRIYKAKILRDDFPEWLNNKVDEALIDVNNWLLPIVDE